MIKNIGFTLLELLIVMGIMALSASFVGPKLWNVIEKAEEREQVKQYVIALQMLRKEKTAIGLLTLSAFHSPQRSPIGYPKMQENWQLVKADSLIFTASGVSNGGIIVLLSPKQRTWEIHFSPIDAKVNIVKGGLLKSLVEVNDLE
jgi:prepilin-type N-terminal cleavage/methylation domain-containing protein